LANSTAFFGIISSRRRHDYAILQLHPAYAGWLKNLLEATYSHRWLLFYLETPDSFPQFSFQVYHKNIIPLRVFDLNLLSVAITVPRLKVQGIEAKAHLHSNVNFSGKEISDSQKFLVWGS
jgi:hypothetical protein